MIFADLYSRVSRTLYRCGGRGVSVICVYNDAEKLNRFLIPGLEKQTYPFELLAIDNREGQHRSAGETLNRAVRQTRFPCLMFVHQDVRLLSRHWLRMALRGFSRLERPGACGVAGKGPAGLVANVFHGSPPVSAGPPSPVLVEAQTLDGCLLVIPRTLHERMPFDESLDGWYLYVANYCLDLARHGYRNWVLPFPVYHESTGPANPAVYEKARRYLMQKHRSQTDVIYTTMGEWLTGP